MAAVCEGLEGLEKLLVVVIFVESSVVCLSVLEGRGGVGVAVGKLTVGPPAGGGIAHHASPPARIATTAAAPAASVVVTVVCWEMLVNAKMTSNGFQSRLTAAVTVE